ncbi:diguanylate phosphodiesterase [Aliidongia dinghuensis]|uniref:Diguanylate phosphodiesterase n=1 Tax=Aliidongia dinghuensis TaxID=1867774 RepID=A0A8J3E764_9PROT|nr:EAL domain-containing protein [Aliidongia dinghuensis]GGF51313.1 diguanylate phosphodiesterase [Aliidongia dinghuensis]
MAEIRADRDRFVAFAFAAADLLIELDANRRIVFATGAAQTLIGVAASALVGRPFVGLFPPADQSFAARVLDGLAQTERIEPIVIPLARPDGGATRVSLGGCRFGGATSHYYLSLSHLVAPFSAEIEEGRDPQTRLLDAEALPDVLKRVSQATGDASVSLTMLHLEGLSALQQRLSEERRNELMGEIGAVLRLSSSGGDAATQISDSEFALVQRPGLDSGAIEAELASITAAASPNRRPLSVRSAQVVVEAADLADKNAAQALAYCVKKFSESDGRDFSLASLEDALAGMVDETLDRVAQMRTTVSSGDFSLVFQPIVDLESGEVHHFEVLSRFAPGESPYEFIVFSEEVGMAAELDLAVCEKVVRLMASTPMAAPVAINLSGKSMANQAFMTRLIRLLADAQINRSKLLFEITESGAIDDFDQADAFLQHLRGLGHRICLDDFGAGFGAYTYLRRFAIDFVKLDGLFLKDGMNNMRDQSLLRSIAAVCAELGAQTIGEMIETREEAYAAAGLGVDFGQGYFFGRPLTSPTLPPLPPPGSAAF